MKLKTINESEFLFEKIFSIFPDTKTELNYNSSFQFLIAVILSAQATDKQVNIVTNDLFELIKEPIDLVSLELKQIENFTKSINYYKTKSKSIQWAAKILLEKFDSKIPNDINLIQELPWVWIKTAKVVLWVLYNAPYIWVDTHVHRICNRIGVCSTSTPEETDKFLEKNISIQIKIKVHHSLVLFWRYICISRKPKCSKCLLKNSCNYFQEHF